MNIPVIKKLCLTMLPMLVSGNLFAQSAIQINGANVAAGDDESGDASAPYVIFSNLGPKNGHYDSDDLYAKPVVGRQAINVTEQWDAVRFVPKVDVQATVLEAAVGWSSGTPAVQMSLYSNDETFNVPATLLPGAQGTTTDVPTLGECCKLAKVVLPQPITLNAGVIYWLVCSPGSKDFNGAWQISPLSDGAVLSPPNPWVATNGEWPAARISGARLPMPGPFNAEKHARSAARIDAAGGRVVIFSNLNRVFPEPYIPGIGILVVGNDVLGYNEGWLAMPFTPKKDVEAKTLSAAVAYEGGTNKINLGLYSDSGGLPGAPLPNGQGSVTDLPGSGDCCDFATLRLLGKGIALSSGVQYWLVASPSSDAEDFIGLWQISTNDIWAKLLPEQSGSWTGFNGEWVAAQITGSTGQ